MMNISIAISVTGALISILSVCYVILSYRSNKGRLKIYFDIGEKGLRIYAYNVGHRPLGIQDVGYYSWTSGSYMVRSNKQAFILLNEGEVKIFEEQFEKDRAHLADIKNIGVRDIRDLENTKLPYMMFLILQKGGIAYENIDFGSEWYITRNGELDFAFG